MVIFILSLVFSNNKDMSEILSLKDLVYLPIAFPFILFYKSRIRKRNIFIDYGYSTMYLAANVVSYVLIAIMTIMMPSA